MFRLKSNLSRNRSTYHNDWINLAEKNIRIDHYLFHTMNQNVFVEIFVCSFIQILKVQLLLEASKKTISTYSRLLRYINRHAVCHYGNISTINR